MALVVQKYGGTSVADIDKIKNTVAKRIIGSRKKGDDLVVVLSAMAGVTDQLVDLAKKVIPAPEGREYDVLVSTGEQVSIALLAMSLEALGQKARSYLGHQVKINTDASFSRARILCIDTKAIKADLEKGRVVIVAGFQGVDEEGNITTLGRGGSDTTAVAIAASLCADRCEIYTDVEGVFSADPGVCSKSRKLNRIAYDEMLEMASLGAKVLHSRSVELAKKYHIPLYVRSTFSDNLGTLVTEESKDMESNVVSGVTYNKSEAKITIRGVPDKPGVAAKIFSALSGANIVVDMILQNVGEKNLTDLTFTVLKNDCKQALKLINPVIKKLGAKDATVDQDISKVSIVGVGMRSNAGIASRMFTALAKEGINMMMISTSEIKISCVISSKYTELAVRVLHDTFNLSEEGTPE